MRLSEREREIILAAQFKADATVPEISRLTRSPAHVVNYTLGRLRREGVLRPWALLNFFTLGFEQFRVFFSLTVDRRLQRQKVISAIKAQGQVVWFAELGGNFQYAMSVYARSGQELSTFLDSLAERFGAVFLKKVVVVDLSFTIFKKKYLANGKVAPEMIEVCQPGKKPELDSTDYKILSMLSRTEATSNREVSRLIGVPRATVDQRIRKLREKEVLLRYVYFVSALKLGLHVFRLLVYMRGLQRGMHDQMKNFCFNHPRVVNLTRCIGPWDYELTVEVESAQAVAPILEDLYGKLDGLVNDIDVLPVFDQSASFNLELRPA